MFRWIVALGIAVMMAACSQTVSASSDESSEKDTEKTGGSSDSNGGDVLSSSEEELGEDCVGEAGKAWDGTTAKAFACGSGTKLSPFIILTAEQLAYLSFVVGASEKDYQGKYFKLAADILLNEGKVIDDKGGFVADSAKLHKWTPIGNSSVAFDGNFDGAGHTVSGMFINTTSTHNGLFGNSSGTVQNVTVADSWVNGGNATAGVVGNLRQDGIAKGLVNKATIVGVGEVTGGVIGHYENVCCSHFGLVENSDNYGFVTGPKIVGGVVGNGSAININGVRNFADISGKSSTGGIIGSLGTNSTLKNARNSGKIAGKNMTAGIAGYLGYRYFCSGKNATLNDAKNTGVVEGEKYTAGIIGKSECSENIGIANTAKISGTDYTSGLIGSVSISTTKSAYNTGNIFGSKYVGGIAGYNEEGVTSAAYSTGKVDGDSLVGLMIGYNYNTTMADYYYLKQGEQEPFGLNNGGGVATPKTAADMKSESFATLLGNEFVYDSGLNSGYPVLKWEKE